MPAPILIVGAGPTGLVLALSLVRRGVSFRIIDRASGPGQASRALAMHARTLEFYRQFGLAEGMVAAGTRIHRFHVLEDGKEAGAFSLDDLGEDLSPYPFILDYPQDEHEAFLGAHLASLGVRIEWDTLLEDFRQTDAGVIAHLRHGSATETVEASYLVGADGARSRVREVLDVPFDGGTYPNLYFVADVTLSSGYSGDLYLAMSADRFALRMPARKGAGERLIGVMPETPGVEPSFEAVRPIVEPLLAARVETLNWFSTYRVHHRVAQHFAFGRVFLAGDAGHLHSPAGGQGMNTGIGDAINLGWKLAEVWHGRAPETLLDSYEPERIAFARRLVATTDRVFQAVVNGGLLGSVVRGVVMPHLIPALTGFAAGRRTLFRTVSQIGIAYPDGLLSQGKAGAVAGGDRLPWVAEADNFAPLSSLVWQLHVYGAPAAALAEAAQALGLPLHRFAPAPEQGLARDAAYLVRPDGYVALALPDQDAAALIAYVAAHGLRFG
jgi:2-polyprenyl-6-methoxyphenol hydroxylase-like FAD-dependent oxidoreductase